MPEKRCSSTAATPMCSIMGVTSTMVITIDGPAAAGKSSVAKALADRLGFDYLDTGAMYRAVALAALRQGVDPNSEQALQRLVAELDIQQRGDRTYLNGEDVSEAIRSVEVAEWSSRIANSPAVRKRMVQLQRRAAEGRNIVAEGRNQGTVVFPQAVCKIFLTADKRVRAQRRQQELARKGIHKSVEQILAEQEQRDQRDSQRAIAPLVPAKDAITIDSTNLSIDEVVDHIKQCAQRAMERRQH